MIDKPQIEKDREAVAALPDGKGCYIAWDKELQQWLARVWRDEDELSLYQTPLGTGWDKHKGSYHLTQRNELIDEAYSWKGEE